MASSTFNSMLHKGIANMVVGLAIIPPLLIGGVHSWTQVCIAAFSTLTLMLLVLLYFRRGYRLRADGFVLLFAAVLLFGLFQVLPMSDSTLQFLSPFGFEHLQKTRELAVNVESRISLNPGGTAQMLVLGLAALACYLIAFNRAYHEGAGDKILAAVAYGGAALAVVSVVQSVLGTSDILGIYTPKSGPVTALVRTTFVNPNNAAGYFALSGFILLGIANRTGTGRPNTMLSALTLLVFGVSLALLSRAGIISLVFAAGLLAYFNRFHGNQHRPHTSPVISIAGGLIAVAAVAVFLVAFNVILKRTGGGDFLVPFVKEDLKVALWDKAIPLISDYKWVGAGLGSFVSAFGPRNDFMTGNEFMNVENEPLQWFIELGTPVAIILIGVGAVLFFRRLAYSRTRSYYKEAVCGLVALMFHNLADFSLRIPGVLIPAALTLGAVSGAYSRDRSREMPWRLRIPAIRALPITAVLYVLAVVGGIWYAGHSRDRLIQNLESTAHVANSSSPEASGRNVSEVLRWLPADSFATTLAGNTWLKYGDNERAAAAYQRASELCPACMPPRSGRTRLMLIEGDIEGALLEMRTMLEIHPLTRNGILQTVADVGIAEDQIGAYWGDDPQLAVDYARLLMSMGAPERAERLLITAQDFHGWDSGLLALLGDIYLQTGRINRADEAATFLIGLFPEEPGGFLLQARVAGQLGDMDLSLLLYDEALRRSNDNMWKTGVSLEVMNILANLRLWDRFDAIATEIRSSAMQADYLSSQYHLVMAKREEMRGRLYDAISELDQAETESPLNDQIALRKGDVLSRLGYQERAALEYRRALRINPGNVMASKALQKIENQAPEPMTQYP